MAKVLNMHTDNVQGAVYIGRGSKYGNPFIIGKHGDRDKVCDLYEAKAELTLTPDDYTGLVDKDLVCFCAPKRCHGDFLFKAWSTRI